MYAGEEDDWTTQQYFVRSAPRKKLVLRRKKLRLRIFEATQDDGGLLLEAQLADDQSTGTMTSTGTIASTRSAGTNAQRRRRKRISACVALATIASSLVFLLTMTHVPPGFAGFVAYNQPRRLVRRVLRFVRTLCADTEFTHDGSSFPYWTDIYGGITAGLNYWDATARVDPGYGQGSYSLHNNEV